MHNVKQESSQDNSAVKKLELPASEEIPSQPFEGGVALTKKPKMSHNWRYLLAGGTALLVFVVILAGVLSSRGQPLKQSAHSVPLPLPTTIAGSISARIIPALAAKPINSPVSSDHNVSVTVVDGVTYAGTADNAVYALGSSNGSMLWHTKIDGAVDESPVVINGIVYVSSFVGQYGPAYFSALRASDGSVLWRYTTDSFVDMFMSDNGVVYVFSQSKLSALRAGDGHQLWSRAIDTTFDLSPQIINGVIYLMATKISLETPTAYSTSPLPQAMDIGTLLWGHGQAASTLKTVPVKATVPLKEGKSAVYAIRASDGTMLWQYAMNNGGDSFAGWLQVQNGVVYTSAVVPGNNDSTGYIAALQSSDGKVLWQDKVDGPPSGVLLTGGTIYTSVDAANGGAVYALRAHDGALLWGYPINGTLFGDPVLVSTTVYIGAGNGMVYALRADNGALVWHYLTDVGS